jgi:hypothetical protein
MEEYAVRGSGWDRLPTSEAPWDEGRARAALDSWAGNDMAKYGRAFLWSDGSGNRKGFKFPIAMPVDGELTVFLHAVNNAKSRMNSAHVPDADKTRMMTILNGLSASYDDGEDREEMSLVAAAVPVHPPRSWFEDPKLPRKTKITVTDEGRVFGHLGTWDSCHLTFANTCVQVPRSRRNYADFHVGSVKTAEGQIIDTGVLTVDTGHADTSFTLASKVKAHYDDTGTQAAVVRVGEDQFGVWFAGSLVPGADEELAQKLRRAPLSGDWRRIGGGLELIAALGVNRPAFAVTASGEPVLDEDGNPVSLDTDVVFRVEDDEVICLIAAFTEDTEDFGSDPIGEVSVDDDCGCPDVKAAIKTRLPLAQRRSIQASLAGRKTLAKV